MSVHGSHTLVPRFTRSWRNLLGADTVVAEEGGIVTASKSAALGARFLATCGSDLLLKHEFKVRSAVQNPEEFREAVAECMGFGALLLTKLRPENYEGSMSFEQLVDDWKSCFKKENLLPMDVNVALAAVRYVRTIVLQKWGR
ncbi:hypothetical protein MTO96_015590 [Rhipicephalus appendiculatus]